MAAGPEGAVTAALNLTDNTITFQSQGHEPVTVPLAATSRSKLFQDMVDSSDATALVNVPVDWEPLQLWLRQQCQENNSSNATAPGHALSEGAAEPASEESAGALLDPAPASLGGLCILMKVADVLIDESTKTSCAKRFAVRMKQDPVSDQHLQALECLPETLQNVILSNVPLRDALTHVPVPWQPRSLLARHPSVTISATLSLPPVPLPVVPTALRLAATHTHLQHLSLANFTLPQEPTLNHLEALNHLTHMNLANIGLQPHSVATLARALPCLTRLLEVNLSQNLLTDRVMHELGPGLAQCTTLQTLVLANTVSPARRDQHAVRALAEVLRSLRRLSTFTLGLFHHGDHGHESPTMYACMPLVETLQRMPLLRALTLELWDSGGRSEEGFYTTAPPAVVAALGDLTQLERLHCTIPVISHGVQLQNLGTRLTGLTSLHMDVFAATRDQFESTQPQIAHAVRQLGVLPSMHALQRLRLSLPIPGVHDADVRPCAQLSEVLPQLQQLTALELRAVSTHLMHACVPEPSVTAVARAARVALALPHLARLHVPVSAAPCAALDGFVQTLMHAAQACAVAVSVDIYVRVGDPLHSFQQVIDEFEADLFGLPLGHPALEQVANQWGGNGGEDGVGLNPQEDHLLVEEALCTCAPLFPKAETFAIACIPFAGHTLPRPPSRGLAAAAAALPPNLQTLTLVGPYATSGKPTAFIPVMNALSRLTGLQRLRCALQCEQSRDPPQGTMHGLGAMSALRHMEFRLDFTRDEFQLEFMRACARLPNLHTLKISGFKPWGSDTAAEIFPRLRVHTLELGIDHHAWSLEEAVAVMRRMQHLRVLRISGETISVILDCELLEWHYATDRLPAFQLLDCYSFSSLEQALADQKQAGDEGACTATRMINSKRLKRQEEDPC